MLISQHVISVNSPISLIVEQLRAKTTIKGSLSDWYKHGHIFFGYVSDDSFELSPLRASYKSPVPKIKGTFEDTGSETHIYLDVILDFSTVFGIVCISIIYIFVFFICSLVAFFARSLEFFLLFILFTLIASLHILLAVSSFKKMKEFMFTNLEELIAEIGTYA
jgi:hypothetical protein